jgi:hypothetical protein
MHINASIYFHKICQLYNLYFEIEGVRVGNNNLQGVFAQNGMNTMVGNF